LSFHDLPRRQDSTHLNDEETMLVETVRAFIDRDVKPTVREAEHDNEYPAAWIEQMKRIGIYGLAISGLATGDVGMVDCDGWVRITGRIKDIINRGGEKFRPAKSKTRSAIIRPSRLLRCWVSPNSAWASKWWPT
jgi:acyl-CoA synthetase (AMP-forming)/AMP-acid ligase II